jgi:hypothetical protein
MDSQCLSYVHVLKGRSADMASDVVDDDDDDNAPPRKASVDDG